MKHQRGSSLLAIPLICVILGALISVGYYVFRQRGALPVVSQESERYRISQAQSGGEKIYAISPKYENDVTEWQQFKNRSQGINFKYPLGWTVYDSGPFKQTTGGYINGPIEYIMLGRIVVSSPEFAGERSLVADNNEKAGVQFELIYHSKTVDKTLSPLTCEPGIDRVVSELKTSNLTACFKELQSKYIYVDARSDKQTVAFTQHKSDSLSPKTSHYYRTVYYDLVRSLILD